MWIFPPKLAYIVKILAKLASTPPTHAYHASLDYYSKMDAMILALINTSINPVSALTVQITVHCALISIHVPPVLIHTCCIMDSVLPPVLPPTL